MKEKITTAKAGQVLVFTNGEYSDFTIHFVGIATQDFNVIELEKEYENYYVSQHPEHKTWEYIKGTPEGFVEYLIRLGLVIESNNLNIHCGDYGISEPKIEPIR